MKTGFQQPSKSVRLKHKQTPTERMHPRKCHGHVSEGRNQKVWPPGPSQTAAANGGRGQEKDCKTGLSPLLPGHELKGDISPPSVPEAPPPASEVKGQIGLLTVAVHVNKQNINTTTSRTGTDSYIFVPFSSLRAAGRPQDRSNPPVIIQPVTLMSFFHGGNPTPAMTFGFSRRSELPNVTHICPRLPVFEEAGRQLINTCFLSA